MTYDAKSDFSLCSKSSYRIIIPGMPIPLKRARVAMRGGFPMIYDSQVSEKNQIAHEMLSQLEPDAIEALKSADYCMISCHYYLPYPSDKRLLGKAKWGLLRPCHNFDLDNLDKMIFDVAQNCIISNDGIVTKHYSTKLFSDNPRTIMDITPHKFPKVSKEFETLTECIHPEELLDMIKHTKTVDSYLAIYQSLMQEDERIPLDNKLFEETTANIANYMEVVSGYADKLVKFNKKLARMRKDT